MLQVTRYSQKLIIKANIFKRLMFSWKFKKKRKFAKFPGTLFSDSQQERKSNNIFIYKIPLSHKHFQVSFWRTTPLGIGIKLPLLKNFQVPFWQSFARMKKQAVFGVASFENSFTNRQSAILSLTSSGVGFDDLAAAAASASAASALCIFELNGWLVE